MLTDILDAHCDPKPSLFRRGSFTLNSGMYSPFKIDCDALTDEDIRTIAWMIDSRLPECFGVVEGVPTGGLRLAEAMRSYARPNDTSQLLIVDDVWTTGNSIYKHKAGRLAIGAVIFARSETDSWVTPLFQLCT